MRHDNLLYITISTLFMKIVHFTVKDGSEAEDDLV